MNDVMANQGSKSQQIFAKSMLGRSYPW